MCTVLIAFRAFADRPLYVAANRDEKRDRPAETFALRDGGARPMLAPRDLRAGGTWIGVNDRGVVVAITNRFQAAPDPDRRSRGELVTMALEQPNVHLAVERIATLEPTDYNGFHLTIASDERAHILWNDSERFHQRELSPGITAVTERSFDAAESQREAWLAERLRHVSKAADLDELLLYRAEDGFEGTLVDVPELNYGTRSSTLIGLGSQPLLMHAKGPPGRTPYHDFSDQLETLLADA